MILEKEYLRENAVMYARKYAFARNPLFTTFEGLGGNCTNFVSQCILAGSCVMNFTPVYGWYYLSLNRRSPSWSGVEFFYDFIIPTKEHTIKEIISGLNNSFHENIADYFTNEITERYACIVQKNNSWLAWNVTGSISITSLKTILIDLV